MKEPFKYDVASFLQKESVIKDIEYVEKINEESSPDVNMYSDDTTILKSNLVGMISTYQGRQSEGIGLVLIAERYNKTKNFATHYAVIFDIASKKILISQKYTTSPDGTGIRNYWASAILSSMKLLRQQYKKWEKKYSV